MKRYKFSFRVRLFGVMLIVAIIPSVVITFFATSNTYNTLYQKSILANKDGILWCQDRLQQYSDTIKSAMYSMEYMKDFTSALNRWSNNQEAIQDGNTMRNVLSTQLNQNDGFSSMQLFLESNRTLLKVERAGTHWQQDGWQKELNRSSEFQTNLYYKKCSDGLYAVHTINRFENRNTVAMLAAKLQNSALNAILSTLQGYDASGICLINDQNETLIAQGPAQDSQLTKTAMEKIRTDPSEDHYFTLNNNLIFYGQVDGGRLNVIKVVPKTEITVAMMPTIYLALIISVLSILGAGFLSVLLSMWVSRPIIQLSDRVKHISIETLEMPAGGEKMHDEIGILEKHIECFVDRIRELIREEYDTKLQAKNAQINALQAQINPHFLYNTLQLMGSMAYSKGVYEVNRVAEALSDILRYSMNYDRELVTLDEELKHLDNYFFIQKQRFYDKFTVELAVDEKAGKCRIPKLLIQPIVENCFKHGFNKSTNQWRLAVMAFLNDDGKIHIIIRDNGNGMAPEQLATLRQKLASPQVIGASMEPEHIGLINVNARIKLFFSENDGIQVESAQNKGTTVTLIFDADWGDL